MTDLTSPSQSPFVLELLRLNAEQVTAIRRGDEEAASDAAHEIAMLLRLNAAGRVNEYFARKGQ